MGVRSEQRGAAAELRRLILERAATPDGYGREEKFGRSMTQVRHATGKLLAEGALHPGRRGHRTVHFFATPEGARAWANNIDQPMRAGNHAGLLKKRAGWAPDAEAIYPTNPDGTPAYKVTVCPPTRAGEVVRPRAAYGSAAAGAHLQVWGDSSAGL